MHEKNESTIDYDIELRKLSLKMDEEKFYEARRLAIKIGELLQGHSVLIAAHALLNNLSILQNNRFE